MGPRPLGPNHSQHQSAKTFQSGPEATKRGAADKTLKSGSEAVNEHRTIVRTRFAVTSNMCVFFLRFSNEQLYILFDRTEDLHDIAQASFGMFYIWIP